VADDFRDNFIIDRYDPVFVTMPASKLKHLRSENSQDAVTWRGPIDYHLFVAAAGRARYFVVYASWPRAYFSNLRRQSGLKRCFSRPSSS
jgi:hypothetical protein